MSTVKNHFVTTDQAAKELEISRRTLYRRINEGQINATKMGGVWLIPVGSIDKLRLKTSKSEIA